MYNIELDQFSGPYDLLLSLIEDNKLVITEISLSKVTDQYIKYMESLYDSDIDPEDLLSFLAVASKLLYLKSKELVPVMDSDIEDGGSLEDHVKLYKLFQDASLVIRDIILTHGASYGSPTVVTLPEGDMMFPPFGVNTEILHESCRRVIDSLKPAFKLPKAYFENTISLRERVDQVYSLLRNSGTLNFKKIIDSASTRFDLIISFLAMLELVNQKKIIIEQDSHFDDIKLKAL